MARINIVNADNKIESNPRRAYFKLKNTGGPKGDKGDTGATGPQGATGAQGPAGISATVAVGSTTTLAPGSNATVTNSSTDPHSAILEFGIPTGAQGPQGVQGPAGERGPAGQTGAKGDTGAAATITVANTNTGAPGTNASVENVGDQYNAVLNFTIPRGDKGDKGDTGATGPMPTIAQTTGQAVDEVMSQKATTDALDAKQDTLTAGNNIDITGATVSTSALVPEVVASLPETGDATKLYFTEKAHTATTATGNPITATITDGAGKMESFQLDGDTYQQAYSGKNLFNRESYGTLVGWAAQGEIKNYGNRVFYIQCKPETTYTIQKMLASPVGRSRCQIFTTSDIPAVGVSVIGILFSTNDATQATITTQSGANYLCVVCYEAVADTETTVQEMADSIMIEEGATASTFEPYVGGIPSPNPDYPQDIQMVTGTQTIAINGTDYPLDLGAIELCKLGTYQDYIWKDGEDWKVRKATANITLNNTSDTSNWSKSNSTANNVYINQYIPNLVKDSPLVATNLTTYDSSDIYSRDIVGICYNTTGGGLASIRIGVGLSGASTVNLFKSWLEENPATVYYALATPTDTVITNQALIAQLEAIRTALLENGANTITNTAAGANLAGDMEVSYYGYTPSAQYDKWLWLNVGAAGAHYEQI